MSEFTVIAAGQNKAGKRFAVWRENRTGTFMVLALCENYAARVRGAVLRSWRYCTRLQTEAEARATLTRRCGGAK